MNHPSASRRRRRRHPMSGSNSNNLSKTTVKATNIESLPDELLFDILARLPAEFLLHILRLVCRKWRRIIHSDGFADAQNINQQHSSAYGLLFSPNLLLKPRPHSIYATATRGRIETYDLSGKCRATIIGCCNGLALELHDDSVTGNGETLTNSLHLMNPITKKSFLLPSFSFQNTTCIYDKKCGIGYSAASMKYKVTLPYKHVEGDHKLIGLAILTVGVDKSWRHVELPDLLGDLGQVLERSPLTNEGFLHWGRRGDCLTLDVETEIFTTSAIQNILYQPSYYDFYYYVYLSTGRYLSLLVGRVGEFRWDVWEMQSGEWRRLENKIDLEAQKEKIEQFATTYDSQNLYPVGWVKYPETLVFRFQGFIWRNCIFYNLKTHKIETIDLQFPDRRRRRRCDNFKALVHRNILVHEVHGVRKVSVHVEF